MLRDLWDPELLGLDKESTKPPLSMRLEMQIFVPADRPFHIRTSRSDCERSQICSCPWALAMDASILVRSEGISLWTSYGSWATSSPEITELQAADRRETDGNSDRLRSNHLEARDS
ncbi:hypothetical protein Tco_0277301 [Tanacetum coccineum]